jgi:hypothetical protein
VLIPRTRLAVASFAGGNYHKKVLATEPANLIGYWPLWEKSGSVADNLEGTAARDGAYIGVTLGEAGIGDGRSCPYFDGTADVCNVYSASLAGAFNGAEGSVALWARVSGAGVWVDGASRYLVNLRANGSNFFRCVKGSGAADDILYWTYAAGGTQSQRARSGMTEVGWMHLAVTWSAGSDELKAYYNGVQEGTTATGLGVWAGALGGTVTVVGAYQTDGLNGWHGNIAHPAVWSKPLSGPQVLDLATV